MVTSVRARASAAAFDKPSARNTYSEAEVAIQRFIDQHCGDQSAGSDTPITVLSHDIASVLNTGRAVDPERWRERKAREKELLEQTDRLADILERNGIPARTKNDSVFAIGLVTGDIDQLPHYRSICFLPAVAKRERAPLLNELRFFRKIHPKHRKYMRFVVVTCGPRVSAGSERELREAFQQLHRDLSRWSQWAFRKYGIEVIGRFSEFTVRNDGNCRTLHPHANVLMTPRKLLSKRRWTSFLRESNERFGHWWSDQGKLRKPEEVIKYVCKPADLEALSELEIVWLFNELYGLKLVQPMGSFQDWRRETLCQRREPGSGWNQVRKVVSVNLGRSPQLRVVAKKKLGHRTKSKSETTMELRTCLLCITLPQRRASPWAEPYALVSTALDPVALGHRAFVKAWEEETLFGDSVSFPVKWTTLK